ncbi:HIT family protein [Alteribacter keqinensis]|uniref:HIT family protein n=1 Tax=Alteribacter keqinensis TaxID=2483800 RepID=A0A3M7TVD9_9BACI|nr:HIT family protein [Alteribacter keqinensis]RNA68714.1 HIT family protein [Alteribacter keqinensis]
MPHTVDDCIFCKIIRGEIPAAKVYEDENAVAFFDISQVTKGHTLVIPKNHVENIFEMEAETSSTLFATVPKIANALKAEFEPAGLNILNNNGKQAGQSVFHYHLHLIPRYGKGDGFGAVWKEHGSEYSQEKLADMAGKVKQRVDLS